MDVLWVVENIIACVLILFDYCISLTCMVRVKSCPQTKEQWRLRELNYHCNDGNYTCMLKQGNELVEACVYPYSIPPNTSGCPFIQKCKPTTGPQLAVSTKNIDCPSDVSGCPPDQHDGYTTNELYRYPACIREHRLVTRGTSYKPSQSFKENITEKAVTYKSQDKTTSLEEEFSKLFIALIIIGIVIFISLVLYICVYRGYLGRLCPKQTLNWGGRERIPLLEGHTQTMLDAHKRELSSTNPTRAEEAATKMLLEKSFVIITGKAGTGKTYTAKNILVKLRKVRKGIPIILTHSDEWRQVDPIARNIILLDDVFGSNNLEIMKLSDWEIHFDSLYECCKNGKMCLIISCRDTILANIEQKLQKYKLFNSQSFRDNIINLSSQEYALTAAEKTDILMHFCRKYDVQVIEEDVTSRSDGLDLEGRFSRVLTSKSISRISQTNPFIGFPQTCFLFFNDERFFRKGVEYFVRANLHLKDTISEMKRGNPQESLVLFYTFLEKYSELDCSHINPKQFETLKQDLGVEMEATDIQEYASSLCPAYLTKFDGDADRFTFQHATIFEAVMQAFGRDYQSTFLKLAGEKLIWDFATSSKYSQKSEEIVLKIRREHAQELAEHLLKHSYWYHHKTMEDEEFAVVVLEKLLSTDDLSPREILKRCSCNEAYHIVRELIKRFHTHSGESNGIPKLEHRHLSHDDLQHALKWAIWKGSTKCIDALATEGQLDLHKDILYEDNVSMTPLTYAGMHDTSGKSVEFLLDKYNVSCDSRDANANTIAHRAAQFGWTKIMKRIISEHSSELSKKNKRQLLPIEVACFYGQSEVLDLLLTNNACPLEPHILMKWTLFGLRFCPLYPSQDVYLDEVGEIKLSEELSSTTEGMFKETFEILEAKYPRCFQSNIMNTIDAFGNTALHYCVLNNLFTLFSFIIQRSSSAVRDKDCLQKVIRICTYLGRVEMLRILSKHSKIDETVNGILGFCSEIDLIRKENLLKCLKTYDANEQTVFDNPQLENEIRNMLKKHK